MEFLATPLVVAMVAQRCDGAEVVRRWQSSAGYSESVVAMSAFSDGVSLVLGENVEESESEGILWNFCPNASLSQTLFPNPSTFQLISRTHQVLESRNLKLRLWLNPSTKESQLQVAPFKRR